MTHKLRSELHNAHTDHDHHLDEQHGLDHGHGHAHNHGGTDGDIGVFGRAVHLLTEALGWHSHDSAESIDDALEADARGRRALWISLFVLAATTGLQAAIFAATNSVALLGDTLHNLVDAFTAVPLLVAFALLRRPANDRFTYGYGRAEDIASLFVVIAVASSAVIAAWQAVDRFIHPSQVHHVAYLAAAGVVGFLGNEIVARYRMQVGRQIGSAALVADGLHARTDGFASLAVVVSAAGIGLGLDWADPAIGIAIAFAIIGVLRSVATQVGSRLLDAVDPELVQTARRAVGEVDEVSTVHTVRMRWVGHSLRAEAEIVVPAHLSLLQGHEVARQAEQHLLEALPRLASASIRVSPGGVHA